ncbi:30729_t:CDS:2, partial [Racocetra persica]
YSKITTVDENCWFIRSLESIILSEDETSLQKADIKVYIATAFIYMISTSHQASRDAYDALKTCVQINPNFVGEMVREGLTNWVLNLEKNIKDSTAILASAIAHPDPAINAYRLSKVLTAITTFSEKVDRSDVEKSLVELIILSHHSAIASPTDKYNWITLAQRAKVDPGKLIEKYSGRILQLIQSAIENNSESKDFYQAALSTISTVTFISPEKFLPLLIIQCRKYLDPCLFEKISEQEIGIWRTAEGTLFVDVLKNKKQVVENRNKKGYQTEKWEREVREKIAQKKGISTPKLTKEEQAAVSAQLAKESETRKAVENVRLKLIKGLDIVGAMVKGNSEAVEQYIVELMKLLYNVLQKCVPLIGEKAVNTYLDISLCTSEKIESIRIPIGLATLRVMEVQGIPEKWLQESLDLLVSRVLFRLRIITERSLITPSSFAY